ncbi:MAG TPA: CDP-alcohol phosphatidyltransferase family protein [Terracidiphilus sp.]|nr:CDP-alcohol phosphatidyltransferase family protein [Terracidiphilus sp.]
MTWRIIIPWSLVVFRLILGPVIVLASSREPGPELWLGILFLSGPISDIYDGVLARRFGTATAALRISDTIVDIVFYLFVLIAVLIINTPAIHHRLWLVGSVMALEAARLLLDLIKFGRIASYHAYSAKLFGLFLMLAVGSLFSFKRDTWLLTAALIFGILSELEGLAFSILLPEWVHDVKTLSCALELRRKLLESRLPHVHAG